MTIHDLHLRVADQGNALESEGGSTLKVSIRAGDYLVLAQYLEGPTPFVPSLFGERYLKVFGPYHPDPALKTEPERVRQVLDQFTAEHCANISDAQRFFPRVRVIQVEGAWEEDLTERLKARYGELIRLPNPRAFSDVDYYFIRGDLE